MGTSAHSTEPFESHAHEALEVGVPLLERDCGRRARQDSNLRLLPPEGSALSTELRAPAAVECRPGMLIAVISDTHMPRGARRLPDACVERIADADLLLHAGDFVTRRGAARAGADRPAAARPCTATWTPPSCARLLPGRADGARPAARASRWSTTPGRAPAASSGCGGASGDADAVVFGHSHLPLHERAATASRSSTPAARPSAAARPRTRWGWRRSRTAASSSSSSRSTTRDRRHGPRRPLRRHRRLGAHRPARAARHAGPARRRPAAVRLRRGHPAPAHALGRAGRARGGLHHPLPRRPRARPARACSRRSACASASGR